MKNNFKTLICLLLFCSFCGISFSQYTKYLVTFTDKNNSPYQVNNPQEYLSQKAIERRTKYNISIDSSDLPVKPYYIKTVLSQGNVSYLSESKWLNKILIFTTDTIAIKKIRKLSFVKSVGVIGPSLTMKTLTTKDKFNEVVQPMVGSRLAINDTTAELDYGNSYNQIHIHNGDYLHNRGFRGDGITIAIIDGGFYHYKSTKAFDSARAHNQFLGEKDFVDFDNSVNEDNSHGEYCLSIIGANAPGTMIGSAPDAHFWLLRSENVNSEYPIEEFNWAVAAEFADSAGADMISSSLGYDQFDDSKFDETYSEFYKNKTIVSKAATFAAQKGMIVTNSAGNEGSDSWKYLVFPADDDSVCAVAATDGSGKIASFSSYGYPGKIKPNISSVGSGTTIYTSSGVASGSGTSFSNPNINGLIACLWQAFPEFNNMTILNAVYQSSSKYASPDNRYGYGLPDMRKAYSILLQLRNKNLYGSQWFMIPSPYFANTITLKLIGRINGNVIINLVDGNDNVVASKKISTEVQEVYDITLDDLGNLPLGNYMLQYNDGSNHKNVVLTKFTNAPPKQRPVISKAPISQ